MLAELDASLHYFSGKSRFHYASSFLETTKVKKGKHMLDGPDSRASDSLRAAGAFYLFSKEYGIDMPPSLMSRRRAGYMRATFRRDELSGQSLEERLSATSCFRGF